MAIYDEKGRDITEQHYARNKSPESARASYQRALATAGARPSDTPARDLRAEGNRTGVLISDSLAIHEAMRHDI